MVSEGHPAPADAGALASFRAVERDGASANRARLPRRRSGVRFSRDGLRLALAQVGGPLALLVLPVAVALAVAIQALVGGKTFDFEIFWTAGRAVLAGESPYPAVQESILRSEHVFVYPPAAAFAMVPFALLPFGVSAALFIFLLLATGPLTLYVLGVRDWRCYGLALAGLPFLFGALLGAVSGILALGLAAAWRWRHKTMVVAAAMAALLMLKIFLWPLLVWLVATRRITAAAVAVAAAVVTTTAAWAALGFAGLQSYPRLMIELARLLEGKGYSLNALGLASGLSAQEAQRLAMVVGVGGLVAVVVVGRRTSGDQASFVLAIAVALALSPIVWLHYFTLLLVPIAIARPRFSALWLVPIAMWLLPGQSIGPAVWQAQPQPIDLATSARVGELPYIVGGIVAAVIFLTAAVRSRTSASTVATKSDGAIEARTSRERAVLEGSSS